mgnify:CR=1 FL=1
MAASPLDVQVRDLLADPAHDLSARARMAAALIAASVEHLPPGQPFAWHRWLGGVRVEVAA